MGKLDQKQTASQTSTKSKLIYDKSQRTEIRRIIKFYDKSYILFKSLESTHTSSEKPIHLEYLNAIYSRLISLKHQERLFSLEETVGIDKDEEKNDNKNEVFTNNVKDNYEHMVVCDEDDEIVACHSPVVQRRHRKSTGRLSSSKYGSNTSLDYFR